MDYIHELLDAWIEDAGIFRVGDQQSRGTLGNCGLKGFQVRVAIRIGVERDDFVPGNLGCRGIGWMRENGRDDFISLLRLSLGGMVRPDHADIGVNRC